MTLFKAYLSKYPEAEPCERVSAILEALSTEEAKSIAARVAGSFRLQQGPGSIEEALWTEETDL